MLTYKIAMVTGAGQGVVTCSPDCYQSEVESGSFIEGPPVSCPGVM